MIVDYLNIFCPIGRPYEADAKLIVDADAVLPGTIAPERFESISRRDTQILQRVRNFKLPQLPTRHVFEGFEFRHAGTVCEKFGVSVFE